MKINCNSDFLRKMVICMVAKIENKTLEEVEKENIDDVVKRFEQYYDE